MTDRSDIHEQIATSSPADWIPFSDRGTWTYEADVALRIQREEQLDPNFQAPWTQAFQAASQSISYLVYYGNSPVEYHAIASVDNFRAHIPMPRQPSEQGEPYTIAPYQETIGRIVTGEDQTFEAYLNRAGIEVRE
ncbi:MAG: hypothetical protein V5A43_00085 [Haloarculaceae archaeon]